MTDIIVKQSSIQGLGAYAGRVYKKDEDIGEYTGEHITSEEADERYSEAEHFYIFQLESGTCIDPITDPTNLLKYINHSCDPNCESEERDGKIFLVALRDIVEGEELSFDYCVVAEDEEDLTCACGATNCKGTMKAEKSAV